MKRGPKTGATITRIIDRRDIIEKAYLELYITNCLDVSPENGLTTLARFLYKNEKFFENAAGNFSAHQTYHIGPVRLHKHTLFSKMARSSGNRLFPKEHGGLPTTAFIDRVSTVGCPLWITAATLFVVIAGRVIPHPVCVAWFPPPCCFGPAVRPEVNTALRLTSEAVAAFLPVRQPLFALSCWSLMDARPTRPRCLAAS